MKKATNNSCIRNNERAIAESDNVCKTAWNIIKSVKSEQAGSGSIIALERQGKLCNLPTLVANEFNDYFVNLPSTIAKNLKKKELDLDFVTRIGNSIYMYETNHLEVAEK